MSGHSKWSSIKHKKAKEDAKRGKIFTKLIKEITVAARMGGGDIDSNPRLRTAVLSAKADNMPKDNIARAIKKGSGESGGTAYEEIVYEGYGPGGTAVIVEIVTDNRNRTAAEIRHTFTKYNGNLGETGCVGWMFDRKGMFTVDKDKIDEEALMEIAIEAGAEDVQDSGDLFEIITEIKDIESVRAGLEEAELSYRMGKIVMIPQSTVNLEGKEAERALILMDKLEDLDDVQNVYSNLDIDDSVLESMNS